MSPTKWKYLNGMISKRDMVSEWIITVMYDYYVIIMMCGQVQGFGKTQLPKLVIRWQNLSTKVAT